MSALNFDTAPSHKSIYFNLLKSGIQKKSREALGDIIAEFYRAHLGGLQLDPATASPEVLQAKNELDEKGIYFLKNILPENGAAKFRSEVKRLNVDFINDRHESLLFAPFSAAKAPKGARYAYYRAPELLKLDSVEKLVNSKYLHDVAELYLNAVPTISSVSVWHSWVNGLPIQNTALMFHQDRGDFRSVNLFLYLTDVNENNGPHAFYPGSHKIRFLEETRQKLPQEKQDIFWSIINQHRYDTDAIQELLGEPLVIKGSEGTGFLEDTNGLHRAVPLVSGERLIFEIVFTLIPQANSALVPVKRPSPTQDDRTRYITRFCYHD